MRRTSHISAMEPDSGLRLFIALPLPAPVKQQLLQFMEAIRPHAGNSWRWVNESNFHITLRFLGNVHTNRISSVVEACQSAAHCCSVLHLEVANLGAFPNWRKPSVLWTGVNGDVEPLQHLASQMEEKLVQVGFAAADKPFRPHITLARSRPGGYLVAENALRAYANNLHASWVAHELVVFKSDLLPQGPLYTPLGIVALNEA